MRSLSFNFLSIPPDYAVVIYSVGVAEGGQEEWDYLWQKAKETKITSQAEIMTRALAATRHQWLLWRLVSFHVSHDDCRLCWSGDNMTVLCLITDSVSVVRHQIVINLP